jgi:hypothetical protein
MNNDLIFPEGIISPFLVETIPRAFKSFSDHYFQDPERTKIKITQRTTGISGISVYGRSKVCFGFGVEVCISILYGQPKMRRSRNTDRGCRVTWTPSHIPDVIGCSNKVSKEYRYRIISRTKWVYRIPVRVGGQERQRPGIDLLSRSRCRTSTTARQEEECCQWL